MIQLNSTDKVCAQRVKYAWATQIATALRDKKREFTSLEEYVEFRNVDTGAP